MQIVWAASENLTIQGSASFNDSELTNSPALINNNPDSPTFGELIDTAYLNGVPISVSDVYGNKGDPLANSPETQANLRARYEFEFGDKQAFWQLGVAHQSESLNEAGNTENQFLMPSWTVLDGAIGIAKDTWRLELYVHNMTDENTRVARRVARVLSRRAGGLQDPALGRLRSGTAAVADRQALQAAVARSLLGPR